MYAAEKNLAENVRILMSYGADPAMKNIDGKTAEDLAHSEDIRRLIAG